MPTLKLKINFRPYPKQAEFFYSLARYTVVEASTKAGKTVACLVWLLFTAASQGGPGKNYWWVAPVSAQTKIAYRRLKMWLGANPLITFNASELFIELPNGAKIWFKSADNPDSLYGDDVHAAVIDEATRCKEESWHAVRSTLTATGGPVKIIGNVRGRRNWAYQLARRAEAGAPKMAYFRLTTYDAAAAGIYPVSEIEDARATLPEAVFNELFLAIPSDDGGNPFGLQAIDQCIIDQINGKRPIAFGVDLAKSVDWTVIIGLNDRRQVCHFDRFQLPWGPTKQRILQAVQQTPTLVNSTGVGDAVTEWLQDKRPGVFEGFKFTSGSKQQLMEGLAVDIQTDGIAFPDGPIPQELREFEYAYTRTGVIYSAPKGFHDDCVCALALACRHAGAASIQPSIRQL